MTFFKALAWGFGLMLGVILAYVFVIVVGVGVIVAVSEPPAKAPTAKGAKR